jgi:hypothetical protein
VKRGHKASDLLEQPLREQNLTAIVCENVFHGIGGRLNDVLKSEQAAQNVPDFHHSAHITCSVC